MRFTLIKSIAVAASMLAATMAHAALGSAPGAPSLTGNHLTQSEEAVRTPTVQSYSAQDSTTQGDTSVREYVGADGSVFAVRWRGAFMPNMSDLLGAYFPQYVSTPPATNSTSLRLVRGTDLVVESTGHMRAFAGLAYVPSKMPVGVTPKSLK